MKFDRETMSKVNNTYVEGVWKYNTDSDDVKLPIPIGHKQGSNKLNKFIDQYEDIRQFISLLDDSFIFRNEYMGYSNCCICGTILIGDDCHDGGNGEYLFLNGTDCIIVPDGYIHYLRVHNVLPSKDFYDYIMSFNKENYVKITANYINNLKTQNMYTHMLKKQPHDGEY